MRIGTRIIYSRGTESVDKIEKGEDKQFKKVII